MLGLGCWVLAFIAALSPVAAQDLRIVHLSKDDAALLLAAHQKLEQAQAEYAELERYAFSKYVTTPALAYAGTFHLDVRNILTGWEWGMLFSPDFEAGAPKPKPESLPACSSQSWSDHYKDTIPDRLWLDLPPKP